MSKMSQVSANILFQASPNSNTVSNWSWKIYDSEDFMSIGGAKTLSDSLYAWKVEGKSVVPTKQFEVLGTGSRMCFRSKPLWNNNKNKTTIITI